jgi:hypothetical protein
MPGLHCVAISFSDSGYAEYFDSYGLPPIKHCYRSSVAFRLLSELDNLSQGNVRGRSPKVHNRLVLLIQHTRIQVFSLIYYTDDFLKTQNVQVNKISTAL